MKNLQIALKTNTNIKKIHIENKIITILLIFLDYLILASVVSIFLQINKAYIVNTKTYKIK